MGLGAAHHDDKITIEPEKHMARLVSRELGHDITPEQILGLFRAHWLRLSIMAHAIHDQQNSKEPTHGR